MNPLAPKSFPLSALLSALISSGLACVVIGTVLVLFGLKVPEVYLYALLAGLIIFCFVWIERGLVGRIKNNEHQLELEARHREESLNKLYSHSMACFVRFDAGTLIIDRASPGFVKMLRMPTDTVLRGQGLEEALSLNPLKLESMVDLIKEGDTTVKQAQLDIQSADGLTMHALISGHYDSDANLVEAAFFVAPFENAEQVAEFEAAHKDLDRFRKGMYRRETRILELKEEVNLLCKELKVPRRYQTDQSSDDSQLKSSASQASNPDGEGEGTKR